MDIAKNISAVCLATFIASYGEDSAVQLYIELGYMRNTSQRADSVVPAVYASPSWIMHLSPWRFLLPRMRIEVHVT